MFSVSELRSLILPWYFVWFYFRHFVFIWCLLHRSASLYVPSMCYSRAVPAFMCPCFLCAWLSGLWLSNNMWPLLQFVLAALVLSLLLPKTSQYIKWIVAAGLAQVSEFSFVLGSRARRAGIISREVSLHPLSVSIHGQAGALPLSSSVLLMLMFEHHAGLCACVQVCVRVQLRACLPAILHLTHLSLLFCSTCLNFYYLPFFNWL